MGEEIFKVYKDTRYNPNGALWEVSNYGNVRKNGKEILPYENTDKYLFFGFKYSVHRAVAELFIPNPEHKPTIDHINRDIHDNRSCNLRWATMKEQAANRNNDAISKAVSAFQKGKKKSEEHRANLSKALMGNKNSLGRILSEETKAKIGAASLGRIPSEEVRTKISKYVSNTVWIIHPMTNDIKRIPKEQIPEYLDKGYIKGRKIKK